MLEVRDHLPLLSGDSAQSLPLNTPQRAFLLHLEHKPLPLRLVVRNSLLHVFDARPLAVSRLLELSGVALRPRLLLRLLNKHLSLLEFFGFRTEFT